MPFVLAAACSALASTGDVGASRQLVLVDNGQPRTVIFVSQEALRAVASLDIHQTNPSLPAGKVAWAAHDLQTYIEKMSGAKLPIVSDGTLVGAPTRILVGRGKLTDQFDTTIPSGLTNLREEEGRTSTTRNGKPC